MIPRLSLRPLRRLRWKLTLTYTLVTVAALVVVEVLVLAGLLLALTHSDILIRSLASQAAGQITPLAKPYLITNPPDAEGLQYLIESFFQQERTVETNQAFSIRLDDRGGGMQILVLDASGRLLASLPQRPTRMGKTYHPSDLPGADPILQRVLAGEGDPGGFYGRGENGELVVVAPVQDGDQLLGALALGMKPPTLDSTAISELGLTVLMSAGIFIILAGAVGTLFGSFTARGLTRRLRRLAHAADSWSQGDFSTVTRDDSQDEIGELAHHLNRMAEQLQNLLHARHQLAAMEERTRLARDLHDSVKQQVFAISMQLAAAQALLESDPQAASARLEEAARLTQQAQRELTGLVRQLRPAALEGRSLAQALREHIPSWSGQTGVQVRLQVHGERPLPVDVEHALFRVAQEALSNVARHSEAGSASVTLEWQEDGFSVSVSDDGKGFDPTTTGPGLGLKSMRERVEALGGRMEVRSAPGHGTTLTFRFPERATGDSGRTLHG
ncbi:MAG: ATP-binding protein [Anaerolineae bacterium]|jgi:NarL family two-component system sensor histidine kinase LiaS